MDPKGTARNYLVKPAAAAAIVAVGAKIYRPGAMVKIPGTQQRMSLPLLAAGATFVAAEAAALINEYLFPHIPIINAIEAPAHTALNVGAQVAITAGVENYMSPGLLQDIPLSELAVFAAAAEVGSTYLTDELFIPMFTRWMQPA